MANVVRVSNYGEAKEFISERATRILDDYHDDILSGGGGFSEGMLDYARSSIDKFRKSRLARRTKASFRKLSNAGKKDKVDFLGDIGSLQHSGRRMQRYIASSRKLRKRWRRGLLTFWEDGYSNSPDQENAVGHTHLTYRLLNNDLVQDSDDMYGESYSYAIADSEKDTLDRIDEAKIRQTIMVAEKSLWEGEEDFSSEANNLL